MKKEEIINKAVSYFDEGHACSQSIVLAFAGLYGLDEITAKRISSTFGGGMGRLREKCGAVTGSFMILGLAYGNTDPEDMETKLSAYEKVRKLNAMAEEKLGTTICRELLQKHTTKEQVDSRQHHKIICRDVVATMAGLLYDMINADNLGK